MQLDPENITTIVEFARAHERAVVATVDPQGRSEAALVGIAALDEGLMIFETLADSRKARNIQNSPRVAVVIGLDEQICQRSDHLSSQLRRKRPPRAN